MGNWIPNDPTLVAQVLKISAAYSPPPPAGFVSPMTWGVEEHVTERFAAAGVEVGAISFQRGTYTFTYPGTPTELLSVFRSYYGPTMNAFEAATVDGRKRSCRQSSTRSSTSRTRVRAPTRPRYPRPFCS